MWYNSYVTYLQTLSHKEISMNKTFVAGLKEILRLAVFALPGALILLLTQSPEIAGQWGVPILFLLRAVDKGIHETETVAAKGLVPF